MVNANPLRPPMYARNILPVLLTLSSTFRALLYLYSYLILSNSTYMCIEHFLKQVKTNVLQ